MIATQATHATRPIAAHGHARNPSAEEESEATSSLPGPIGWLDRYTKARPSTGGDLDQNSYIQPMFHAIPAGFAFMGMQGIAVGAAASLAATFVGRKVDSRALGFAVGAVTGAVTAAALGGLTGPVGVAQVVGGALLGGIQSFRGDKEADVRDSSGNATLISGLFLPGTSKLAGAVGSGLGACLEDEPVWKRMAAGAVTGAALGGVLSAIGMAPAGMALTVGLSALAGGIGPVFGPRFSQGFRNLGNDSGKMANNGLRKLGVPEEKLSEDLANQIGAFPGQFLKEGLRGFINSDMQISGMLVGGAVESFELIELYWEQKRGAKKEQQKEGQAHQPSAPAASQLPMTQ